MSALGLLDWQVAIVGGDGATVVLGPGTPYLIHDYQGLGIAAVKTSDIARAQDDGDFYGTDFRASRTITLTTTVTGTSPSDARANLDAILKQWWLRSSENTRELHFKLPGQVEQMLNGRPRSAPPDVSHLLSSAIPVDFEFYSANAEIAAAASNSVQVQAPTASGGRVYPRVYPQTYGGTGASNTITVTNAGTYVAKPTLLIQGPATNPIIENVTQGKSLSFAITLGSTDFLEIDTDARSILLNGTASRRSTLKAGSQWWDLEPGASEITYVASGATGGYADVQWSDAWI